MKKSSQNCLNCGDLKEKSPQNILIAVIFLHGAKFAMFYKLEGKIHKNNEGQLRTF